MATRSITHGWLDVTTTSTARPDLLYRAYRSFHAGLLHRFPRRRLILNVDPIFPDRVEACIAIAKCFFRDSVVRVSDTPMFSEAVRWCWQQTESDWYFHLEDDWLLRRPVCVASLERPLLEDPDVGQVVLQVRRLRGPDQRFSLRPHLGRGALARQIAERLPPGLDPEKALYRIVPALDPNLRSVDYPNHQRMIIDMGSKWKKAFGKVKQARTGRWLESGGARRLRRIDYALATLRWKLVLIRLERLRWGSDA